MQDTALPWLVLQRTHSSVQVGLLLFCRYVPFTLFGLSAGVLADRFDNLRFLIVTQSVSMAVAAALAVVSFLGGPLAAVYVLAALGGTAVVFDAPNRQAMTFRLVGRDELPNAVALNSSIFNAGRVIGPALAGVVIAAAGVGACFALNAASFLAVLTALLLIRRSELYPVERPEVGPRGVAAIREGIAFVWRLPGLRLIIASTAVIGVIGFNFRVLIPVLTAKTLHAGPRTLGVLFALFGLGALAGALVAASVERPRWRRLLAGLGLLGLAMAAVAITPSVWVDGLLLSLVGFGFSIWSATSQSILQLTSPDALRGRVISLYIFVFAGLAPVGSLLSGWLAAIGGARLAFFVAGATALATAGFGAARIRALQAHEPLGRATEYVEPPV